MHFHIRPLRSAQHDQGYPAPLKVLLISNALVSGNKYVETRVLSSGQQVAVAQSILSPIFRLRNCVTRENSSDARRGHMVKENEHSPGVPCRQG